MRFANAMAFTEEQLYNYCSNKHDGILVDLTLILRIAAL